METFNPNFQWYKLSFHGSGRDFFSIVIVNWLFIVLTLGLYYPWAKAKTLRFLYGSTALNGDRFSFNGTGKEMFRGFIKAISILVILLALHSLFVYLKVGFAAFIVYVGMIAIVPLAIHGSYRYRMSRTSWRGIRLGYRGERDLLIKNYLKYFFFTIITFGIYRAWMTINLRNYLLSHVRLGSAELQYKGKGDDYLWINLKGFFLTFITFGILIFLWKKNLFEYYVNNLTLRKDYGEEIRMRSIATYGDFFSLVFINFLIIVFTLGFGYAWVVTRKMDFMMNKIELAGDVDLNSIRQSEENFYDAAGEDLSDMLDLNFDI